LGADSHNALALHPGESKVVGDRPKCSKCGADMYQRRASTGPRKDERFWGCGNFFNKDPRKKCGNTININHDGSWYDKRTSSMIQRKRDVGWQKMGIKQDKPVYTGRKIDTKPKTPKISSVQKHILPDDSEEQIARKDDFVITMTYIPTGKETATTVNETKLKLLLKEVDFEITKILQMTLSGPNVTYDVTERYITDEYLMR